MCSIKVDTSCDSAQVLSKKVTYCTEIQKINDGMQNSELMYNATIK